MEIPVLNPFKLTSSFLLVHTEKARYQKKGKKKRKRQLKHHKTDDSKEYRL
jgi:hypothetical protein